MYTIEIYQVSHTVTKMAELLRDIANMIESGKTHGGDRTYNPEWELKEVQ